MPMPQQFKGLTDLLGAHRALWQCQPFVHLDAPWHTSHPELAAWLDTLPDTVVDTPTQDWLGSAPTWVQDLATNCASLSALPDLPTVHLPAMGARAARGITGRKVKQIDAFCAALLPQWTEHAAGLVDWCAGKGHLGRTLAQHTGAPLLALEWDQALADAGQRACDRLGLVATFACVDVRLPVAARLLCPDHWIVALHACGDLHAALLAGALAQGVAGVAVAPCCYNLASPDQPFALSQAGRATGLRLQSADLDLVHREPLVASGRDRSRALQEQAWRLGFDALQRVVTGSAVYRTMPPFPRPWLRLQFGDFCQQFAGLDGLALPETLPFAQFETQGWQRLARVQRRELLRGLFRAPLEAWMVLDRGHVLTEAGWQVAVGAFCPRTVTPRNALIVGQR